MRGNMAIRLDYIDIAKGILIILVVIGHIWQRGPVFNIIYAFHMPAFFLISGMLLQHTGSYRKPFGVFLKSRLFSFGIPFIFIEILGCLTDIIRHGVTLNWKGYLFNTLTFNFNDHNLWFLTDLFLIEILFYVLLRTLKKKSYIILAACLLCVASRYLASEAKFMSVIRGVFYYNLFFTFGFYESKHLKKFSLSVCAASTIVVLLVGLLLGKSQGNVLSLKGMAYIISGLCGSYAVIQAGKIAYPKKIHRILSQIGKNTITIFGTHHIIYAAIGVLLGITDFGTTPIVPGLIMLFGVAVLEIPVIYIINRFAPWLAGKHGRKFR